MCQITVYLNLFRLETEAALQYEEGALNEAHYSFLRDGLPLFKALSSETRIAILELLIKEGPMRMTAIAESLEITGGAITSHVKLLHEAGLIQISSAAASMAFRRYAVNVPNITVDVREGGKA